LPERARVPVILGSDRKALGSKQNVNKDVLMSFHMCLNVKISTLYISQNQDPWKAEGNFEL